jgi:hypothetical protein
MADIPADLDITTDLNAQGDVQPYHGDAVPQHRQGDVPAPAPENVPEASAPPAQSLRDTLTNAFKGGDEAPKVDAAPEAVPAAEGPELVKVGERFHRKDGSFASREEIDAFNAAAAPAGQAPISQAPQAPWMQGLTELEKTQLAALPAETRQFVERTMESVEQRAAQYQEYGQLEQVIGPRREPWASNGMTPLVAINQLLSLSDFAGSDPKNFVLWFADQHQIDLDAALDERDALAEQNGTADPRIIGLQQEIAQLRNTIGGFSNLTMQQQQAQNFRAVQTFSEEKDASGNLVRPYFNEVANEIAQHVTLIRQQQPFLAEPDVLQAAYDFATYNNPSIRDRMQQAQVKALQEQAAAEAARARQTAVSINGGPAGDTSQAPNNANRTLRDELTHAYNQSMVQ